MASNLLTRLKENPLLSMVVCCVLPLALLAVLMYGFGVRNAYLTWGALLLCTVSHLVMMGMHAKTDKSDKKAKRSCH